MKYSFLRLAIIFVCVFILHGQANAESNCDKNYKYFSALADGARLDPQGAVTVMGKNRDHYLARLEQIVSGRVSESICGQFVAAIRLNWKLNISEIFPKLNSTPKPVSGKQDACAQAFIIIANFALKQSSPNKFAVYVWAANTALVLPSDCQWIVDAYS
jgi:hypothetical protein